MRVLACMVLGLGIASCSFSPASTAADGGVEHDAAVPITVGFQAGVSLEDEMSGAISIPVTLSAPATTAVTVKYSFTGGSASASTDYAGTSGTLTFPPGETRQTVDLVIKADMVEEQNETIEITLDTAVGADLIGAVHTVTISSDVLPRVSFSLPSSSGNENAGVTISVTLDGRSAVPVTVSYELSGSASSADHDLVEGTVTFPPDILAQQITVGVLDDVLDEDDETLVLTLTNSTKAVIGSTKMRTHRILDNDEMPRVSFAQASSTVNEGTASATITLSLSAISGRTVTVPFAASGTSTALAPADYAFASTTVTFPAGTASQTITVLVANDALDELAEQLATSLGTPTNATIGTIATHTLEIQDDDAPPSVMFDPGEANGSSEEDDPAIVEYRVVLSGPSGLPISVPITFGGNATNPVDYTIGAGDVPVTFAAGETAKKIRLQIVDDDIKESSGGGRETITMSIPSNGNLTNVTQGMPSSRSHAIEDDD